MTGLIILAAGESARLGQPKQNLVYQNKTLLQRAIETALASVCTPVIVVLGANEELIQPTISQYPIKILSNSGWTEGIASSIRLGINELQQKPEITSVILMLCDQPFVNRDLLIQLVEASTANDFVASVYDDAVGVPVLVSSKYFEELLTLNGDEGAKKLLLKYPDKVISTPFRMGGIDIDTIQDYEKLSASGNLF